MFTHIIGEHVRRNTKSIRLDNGVHAVVFRNLPYQILHFNPRFVQWSQKCTKTHVLFPYNEYNYINIHIYRLYSCLYILRLNTAQAIFVATFIVRGADVEEQNSITNKEDFKVT